MEDISRDIITKAARGDIRAFEEIYKKTSVYVYNIALRVANSVEDADEITQDVFMKVYNNLGRFNFLSSFKTWIYRITVNTAINYKKASNKHAAERTNYDAASQVAYTEETQSSAVEKDDNQKKLSVLLNNLNPDQRACLVLREIEGLDYKEIASILKININTVRTRLKRARQKLLEVKEKRD